MNDEARKAFPVKKVMLFHRKGTEEIITETEIAEAELQAVIEAIGYKEIGDQCETYNLKVFHSWGK